jgi:hypothetical protein
MEHRRTWIAALSAAALAGAVAAALFGGIRAILNRGSRHVAEAVIRDPEEHTTTDADGAVRSIQGADITMPAEDLEEIWTPEHLERLARTYWRFLTRATLGLIRVAYSEDARFIVLLARPLVLLRFQAPEYEMNGERGIVRWRIERGLLVSRAGRGGNGYLEIDVRRIPTPEDDDPAHPRAAVHVEVEVANFYPSIASGIGRWVYANTQSRIHVIVTHAFLRSLARLDLATSKVGRWVAPATAEAAHTAAPHRDREESSSAVRAAG